MRDVPKPISIALLIAILCSFTLLEVAEAVKHPSYVSDEVWYVDAARNLLNEVFHAKPKGWVGATLCFSNSSGVEEALRVFRGCKAVVLPKIPGVFIECRNRSELLNASVAGATIVFGGFPEGNAKGICSYLNLEHPPLAKYLVALVMVLAGDSPPLWRVPSIVFGDATILALYAMCVRVFRRRSIGLAACSILAIDPLFRAMACVQMLDIYVAFFTVLALWLAFERRPVASCLAIAVGACFKFSSLFAAIPVAIYVARMRARIGGARDGVSLAAFLVSLTVLAWLGIYVAVSIPIWMEIGFGNWWSQGVTGAIAWHMSVKCRGSSCPPASTPLDWFLGRNPFPLYLAKPKLIAKPVTPLWIAALATLILFSARALALARDLEPWVPTPGVTLGYAILYALGGRTQYSFYAVQLSPLVALWIAWLAIESVENPRIWIEAAKAWIELAKKLVPREHRYHTPSVEEQEEEEH